MSDASRAAESGPPAPPPVAAGHGWLIWLAATLFVLYQLAAQTGYSAIQDPVVRDLGLSVLETTLVSSSFLIVYSLLQMPAGLLLDRLSVRWLLAISSCGCALATYAFSAVNSAEAAIAVRALMGMFAALAFPGAGLIARRWISPARLALAFGLTEASFGAGALLGDWGFGRLLAHLDWRSITTLLAAIGLGVSAVVLLVVRDRPPGQPDRSDRVSLREALGTLFRSRTIWLAMLYYGGAAGTIFGFGGLWDIRLQRVFGFSQPTALSLNNWLFLGLALGAPAAGALADRLRGRKWFLAFGALGAWLGVAAVIFVPMPLPYAAIVFNLFAVGLLLGVSAMVFPVACDAVPPRYAGTAIGVVNGAGCLLGGLLQILPALMLDAGREQVLVDDQRALVIFLIALGASVIGALALPGRRSRS